MNIKELQTNPVKIIEKNLNKNLIIRCIFYFLILFSIIFKGVFFQGFIENKNVYSFDFFAGYSSAIYFFKYYAAFAGIFLSFGLLFRGKGKWIYLLVIDLLLVGKSTYFGAILSVICLATRRYIYPAAHLSVNHPPFSNC